MGGREGGREGRNGRDGGCQLTGLCLVLCPASLAHMHPLEEWPLFRWVHVRVWELACVCVVVVRV